MSHRFVSVFLRLGTLLLILASVISLASQAHAQNLAFTPGVVATYSGDFTGVNDPSSGTYTGPLSGLVLSYPYSIAFDADKNLYIADMGSAVVRVVAASTKPIPTLPNVPVQPGNVYTVAGNSDGTICSSATNPSTGDGCPATQASVSSPSYISVDSNGNVFIADQGSSEVRVVYGGGTVPTLASPVKGVIYGLDSVNAALAEALDTPNMVKVDAQGNIYISSPIQGKFWVIYSGHPSPGNPLGIPSGTAAGSLYPVNYTPCDVYSTGTTCGDGGPFAQAGFQSMNDVSLDSSGNFYILDGTNSLLRVIYEAGNVPGLSNPTPGNVYTVVGGGSTNINDLPMQGAAATSIIFFPPYGPNNNGYIGAPVFDAAGDLYFPAMGAILKVDLSGNLTMIVTPVNYAPGTPVCPTSTDQWSDGCPANMGVFNQSEGIAVDASANVYFTDPFGDSLIREVKVSNSVLDFTGTVGLPVASSTYYISNTGSQSLKVSDLNFSGSFAQTSTGGTSDCSTSTVLAPGASCPIAVAFTGTTPGNYTGDLNVASNSLNAIGGNNTLALNAVIAQATTTTTLSSNAPYPSVVNAGQAIIFNMTVAPQFGDTLVPSGTVTLMSGANKVGSGTLTKGAVAVSISNLLAGANQQIMAIYGGDSNFLGSTSSYVLVNVASASAPVALVDLTASPSVVTIGQSVTLTATVTAQSGTPITSGTITFEDGDHPLGAAVAVNSSGVATFTTSTLPIGSNLIVASFSGITGYGANFSNSAIVTVNGGGQLAFTPGVIQKLAGVYPTITDGQYGTPNQSYTGDGGLAVNATLNFPEDVTVDGFGNVYIADWQNNLIRVVASNNGSLASIPNAEGGKIYTFAGGGTCSPAPCGDGGQATQAALSGPRNVAVDAFGNVYIVDGGAVVRKVNTQGVIQSVAGSFVNGIGYGGDGGPATSAQINANGIVVDNAGNLYIADGGNNVIRRVDALTGLISTVAGTPQKYCDAAPCGDGTPATTAFLNGPGDVALDPAGDLYIADTNDQIIRRVDAKTGIISTVAGTYGDPGEGGGFSGGYSGDGGLATSAQLDFPISISVDNAGNLYILDSSNARIRIVNAQSGTINTVVGGGSCTPSSGPCGDGGLATNAELDGELGGMNIDSQGNLYVTHAYMSLVREIPVTTSAIAFGPEDDGTTNTQTFTVTNIGAQPLNVSGLTIATTSPSPGPNPSDFSQQPSGETDCTSNISLAAGATCNIVLQWFPTIDGAETATATVASNSLNATNGNNVISLRGTGESYGGSTAQTITFPALPASVTYGQSVPLAASASSGLPISYRVSGPGTLDATGTALTVTGTGAIAVTAYQFGNGQYAAATPVPQSTTSSGGPVLTVMANNISVAQGVAIPALTYTIDGLVNGDTTGGMPALTTAGTSSSPIGTYPISIAQGTLTAPAGYQITFVPGTLYITGTGSQTITFGALSPVTYGVKPITLSATASSKLPVTFTVASGPGYITGGTALHVTGAGQIVINANQYGDANNAAAPIVSQTLTVNQAPLTVTANSVSIVQGQAIPVLTGYTINTKQLVNSDTQAVLSGTLSETTTATQSSPPGNYPINITAGTLTAANYTLTFAAGTLTIDAGQTQTISFAQLPSVVYGVAPFALNAKSSAGLAINYIVAGGPAVAAGNILTITGAGTITVTATQPGAGQYGPATPVSQTFTVAPAVLTLTANNATRMNNQLNPNFTYTITGFVNADTVGSATSGAPQITTTATPGSPVGTYPIVPATVAMSQNGTQVFMSAANYAFVPVNGMLTITSGGPASTFALSATPQQLSLVAGQTEQTTISLTPQNFYQGLVTLSCGTLPANVQCLFTPATVSPDGTAAIRTTTLTISTSSATTVVAGMDRKTNVHIQAASFYLPGLLAGLLIVFRRRGFLKSIRGQQLMILAMLLTGLMGIAACGGSSTSSSSQNAAPGTFTITVTAKGQDGTTNTVPVSIQVL